MPFDAIGAGRPIRAEIDLAAFQANIAAVETLTPNANCVVVVKADAYGHGLLEMARSAGERSLAVASADEAQRLIDAGIDRPIWVLEGPFSQHCLALSERHPITWVIHSLWQLALLERSPPRQAQALWLKLDTGMHRLGFAAQDLTAALRRIQAHDMLNVAGLMSHFANSDVASDLAPSPSVRAQLSEFDQLLACHDLTHLPQSLANSAAIVQHPASHRSIVRPGIMLYGSSPIATTSAKALGLRPVMQFSSAVMGLSELGKGESVGYGSIWRAERATRIATIAAGYGDGYPRHVKSGTPVAINGQIAPLVGRVSMDMLTVDVSELDSVAIGDRVELWGQQVSVDSVATAADTIAYTLLTGITARVPKHYIQS